MFLLFLIALFSVYEIQAADESLRINQEHKAASKIPLPSARVNYGSVQRDPFEPPITEQEDVQAVGKKKDPDEYNPKRHPVLSRSLSAKRYVECSTLCCFFSKGWFRIGYFLSSVATTGIAGLAYGISDPHIKDQLGLVLLILTVATPALKKFEQYAEEQLKDDEDEYGMFLPDTAAGNV